MLGFSGTPYLSTPEKIKVTSALTVRNSMLANVVDYYPLANAIGNFLKIPEIKSSNLSAEDILNNGIREFLDKYKDTVYPEVGIAKMAIYCGSIEALEKNIYPVVSSICIENNLDPDKSILRYYLNDNKGGYKCSANAEALFRSLDTPFSKVRFVLLVRIGKEGWNCKSLTGVILPSENSSAKNMVLQTTCRCLREVSDASKEHALIWLNQYNERKLDEQLRKEHHTSVAEIQSPIINHTSLTRHSRQEIVKLPRLSYLQLRFNYKVSIDKKNDIAERLKDISVNDIAPEIIYRSDLSGNNEIAGQSQFFEQPLPMEFNQWLYLIVKESFATITMQSLITYKPILNDLFQKASEIDVNGIRRLRVNIGQRRLRSQIRKCFSPIHSIEYSEELIPCEASLLRIDGLNPCFPGSKTVIYPDHQTVENILNCDKPQQFQLPIHIRDAYDKLISLNQRELAENMIRDYVKQPASENIRTYQYIPYTFDSSLEKDYYANDLSNMLKEFKDIEVYFNGDESTTEFYIDCYDSNPHSRRNIGRYFPDFIILKRSNPNTIAKVIIVETKGGVFEAKFKDKKDFLPDFINANNKHGSTRFDFLHIPENWDNSKRLHETKKKIQSFLYD